MINSFRSFFHRESLTGDRGFGNGFDIQVPPVSLLFAGRQRMIDRRN